MHECFFVMFEGRIFSANCLIFLSRLASRVVINSNSLSYPGPSQTSGLETKSSVAGVVLTLASILVSEAEAKNVASSVEVYDAAVAGSVDPQVACLELFEALGGDNALIVRALKLVNQGVVLYALTCLRSLVPSGTDILTKDVRGPSGWMIFIDVFENIRIRHVRREQSIDAFGDSTNHFEYEFEITATLDKELSAVHATWLRINEVSLASTMDLKRRSELQTALGSGGRIFG